MLGMGGHARVLLEALAAAGMPLPHAALDSDRSLWKKTVGGVTVAGGDDLLTDMARKGGIRGFVVGAGGVGDNRLRKRLFEAAIEAGLTPVSVIHPAACVSPSASLAPGVQVLAGSVISAGATLAANSLVNSRAVAEHDCSIGCHSHLAPASCLCGNVTLATGAHVGAGATVIQGIHIGAWAVIGAGATVIRDVPAHTVVVGIPAMPIRNRLFKNSRNMPGRTRTA